jgi:hypothetical protein
MTAFDGKNRQQFLRQQVMKMVNKYDNEKAKKGKRNK